MPTNNLVVLREKVKSLSAKTSLAKDSDGYFQLTVDAAGNGSSIIRFLPAYTGEEFPFVQLFNHAFQGKDAKWFIENCPGTLNRPCPVCEANKLLLTSGNDAHKKLAATRKRKMSYVSSVLVVKDPKAPQNEGSVLRYKYGVKVMDKIKDMIAPTFGDIEAIDPFDSESGANFRLRVVKNGNFPDYDKSAFDKPSPIGDDATIQATLKQCRSLQELIAPATFKSYDDLKAKFYRIVGTEIEEPAVTAR